MRAGLAVASADLNNDADNPVTPEPLEWADMIFVMAKAHRNERSSRFKEHLGNKKVICLDIPDIDNYMDPALVRRRGNGVRRQLRTL